MARWKTCGAHAGGSGGAGGAAARGEAPGAACAAHVSRLAAAALVRAGAPKHCYNVLAALLPYWKEKTASEYFILRELRVCKYIILLFYKCRCIWLGDYYT